MRHGRAHCEASALLSLQRSGVDNAKTLHHPKATLMRTRLSWLWNLCFDLSCSRTLMESILYSVSDLPQTYRCPIIFILLVVEEDVFPVTTQNGIFDWQQPDRKTSFSKKAKTSFRKKKANEVMVPIVDSLWLFSRMYTYILGRPGLRISFLRNYSKELKRTKRHTIVYTKLLTIDLFVMIKY